MLALCSANALLPAPPPEEASPAPPLGIATWPDLTTVFLAFVHDIYGTYPSTPISHVLTRDIYDLWIAHLLASPTALKQVSTSSGLQNTDSPTKFFQLLDQVGAGLGADDYHNYILFQYIGLYHFVVWAIISKSSPTSTSAWPGTTVPLHLLPYELFLFVKEQIRDRTYPIKNNSGKVLCTVKIKSSFLEETNDAGVITQKIDAPGWVTAGAPDVSPFVRGFVAELHLMFNATTAGNIGLHQASAALEEASGRALPAITNAQRFFTASQFIQAFRNALQTAVRVELAAMISRINPQVVEWFGEFAVYGTGDGTTSKYFFGRGGYGLCFVQYQFDGDITFNDASTVRYLGIANPRKNISVTKGDHNKAFLAYLGLDVSGSIELDIYEGTAQRPVLVLSGSTRDDCYFIPPPSALGMTYYRMGSLRGRLDTAANKMLTGSIKSKGGEEIAAIVFKNSVPLPPVFSIASESMEFDDDEFLITTAKINAFWTGAKEAELDAVIVSLFAEFTKPNATLTVTSHLTAGSIGLWLGSLQTLPHRSLAVTSKNQQESKNPLSQVAENKKLRYAHGRVDCRPSGTGGTPGVILDFATEGYVSPLRVKWIGWSKWLAGQEAYLFQEIGQYMRVYNSADGPTYNPPLSALRAFSMLEGMIHRMTNRINLLTLPGKALHGTPASKVQDVKNALTSHLEGPGVPPGNVAEVSFRQAPLGKNPPGPEVTRTDGSIIYVDWTLFDHLRHPI